MESRAEQLRTLSPQLVADVTMYPPSEGRQSRAFPGGGVRVVFQKINPLSGMMAGLCLGTRRWNQVTNDV
jgi:hypothetical protein